MKQHIKKLAAFSLLATVSVNLYAQEISQNDLQLFGNAQLTKLQKKASPSQIEQMNSSLLKQAALAMKEDSYAVKERFKSYECYLSPQVLAKELKTSGYSQFENPTGIYFAAGDSALLWVGPLNGADVSLVVQEWGPQEKKETRGRRGERNGHYKLKEGLNVFAIKDGGNSYIRYYADATPADHFRNNKKKAKGQTAFAPVQVHIVGGRVNGVFNAAKDDNKRWNQLLDGAVSPVMDVVGQQTQLIYSVASLKREAYGKGVELVALYDSLIGHQHQIMGLKKYNRIPKNHMLGRVIWNGFMHADGLGAAFHDNTMVDLANVDKLRTNSWGVAHEFGHVNQVRPNMKWVGTTEVTNNIFSVWSQYYYNGHAPKLEREVLRDYDGLKIGGRITAYMESAFVHEQPWLTQAGNDRWDRERPRDWGGDHFVKLVPFWQLQLYFAVAGKGNQWYNPDFYGDIYIQAIDDTVTKDKEDSYYQLAFVKRACDVAKLDLTDFFVQSRMLHPVDLWVDDYTCAQMTITPADIEAIKQYASKYPKPTTPVLHYLTANSVEQYRKQLPLSGKRGKGYTLCKGEGAKKVVDGNINATIKGDYLLVDNSTWKNAVAFETYANDKLVKVAFVGAGSNDLASTVVHLPEGYTTVKAVGFDGTRLAVID